MADNPDVRVGTAEREQALSALGQHFSDGRLTVAEFDERSAAVTAASTRGQLDLVFTDLPEPSTNPTPGLDPAPSRPLDLSKSGVPATPSNQGASDDEWDWRKTLVAITPIVALILFFVVPISQSWLFFLLIPLVGAVVYGGRERPGRSE